MSKTSLAMKAISLSILLFSIIILNSSAAFAAEHNVYIVLLDLSGSVQKGGENSQLEANLKAISANIRKTAKKNDEFYVIGFARNASQLLKVKFPGKEGPKKRNITRTARLAEAKLRENLKKWSNGQLDSKSTDILGTLLLAQKTFNSRPDSKGRTLYLFSDMLETEHYKLNIATLAKQGSHIKYLKTASESDLRVPNLAGVDIYCNCKVTDGMAKMNVYEQLTATVELEKFWRAVFKASKGNLKEYTSV